MRRACWLLAIGCAALSAQTGDAEKLAPYYPTPETIVEKMLSLGGLKAGEREHRVTWYSGVPTMHQMVLARTHHKAVEAASLRFMRSCSAPLSAELIHKMEDVFGVPFVEAYGMTEAAHQMTSNPLPPRHRKPGSVGVGAGLRIAIMDKEGNHLDTNQRG